MFWQRFTVGETTSGQLSTLKQVVIFDLPLYGKNERVRLFRHDKYNVVLIPGNGIDFMVSQIVDGEGAFSP